MIDRNEFKRRREALSLSAEELGERVGLSRGSVGKLERGERQRPQTINKLVHALEAAEAERAGVVEVGTVNARLTAAENRIESLELTVAAARSEIAALVAELRAARKASTGR